MNLLVLDFGQYQPAVVPASGTSWVSNDLPLGLVQTFGAERIILGHSSKLA